MSRRRNQLPKLLKRLRAERGWSQVDLAEHSGVSSGYISMLEAGTRENPAPKFLHALAGALGVPVAELGDAAGVEVGEPEVYDAPDTVEAIAHDPHLSPTQRDALISVYWAMREQGP